MPLKPAKSTNRIYMINICESVNEGEAEKVTISPFIEIIASKMNAVELRRIKTL